MDRNEAAVNRPRTYHSPRRADQARQTRSAVVDAARELFLSEGFAATTVAAIAGAAAVSVETVYKGFGGKPGLVRAVVEQALAGAGPVPAEARSDHLRETEPDARAVIQGWGRLTTEVAPKVTPLLLLLRSAAATDPEMARLLNDIEQARHARMSHNARRLAAGHTLRPDVTVRRAADVLWTYSSPELYELLVLKRGWSLRRYGDFVADAIAAALLPPGGVDDRG